MGFLKRLFGGSESAGSLRAALEAQRRASGVCVDCGGPIVRDEGAPGRTLVRCSRCSAATAAAPDQGVGPVPPSPATPSPTPAADRSPAQQLRALQRLLADGAITEAEYESMRAEIAARP